MPYAQGKHQLDPPLPVRRLRSAPRRIENVRRALRSLERTSDGPTLSERVAALRRQIGT
jgi:hypothetical protein